jgi:hypothetical protein
MALAYEERTVAFIDIMGFSALVQRSVVEPAFFGKLYEALRLVERQGRVWAAQHAGGNREEAIALASSMDFRSHVFSDSVVLSQRGSVPLFAFLRVSQLAMALLDLGVLVRGGIATGLLHHDDEVVFGPGLVEAYQLESKCAKFPRIVVSPQGVEASRHNLVHFPDRGPEGAYFASEFLRRDADRMYHLDYLTTALLSPGTIVGGNEEELRRRLEKAATWAVEEFRRYSGDADVQAKLGWFLDYFNDFARIRTSHLPDLRVEPRALDDDEMDPVVTWEDLRAGYYRRAPARD